jgi:hypothetical protein
MCGGVLLKQAVLGLWEGFRKRRRAGDVKPSFTFA